jgi:hypothetical protein
MKTVWVALRANWTLVAGFAVLVIVASETLKVRKANLALMATIQRDRAVVVAVGDRIGDLTGTKMSGMQARSPGGPAGGLVGGRDVGDVRLLSAKSRCVALALVQGAAPRSSSGLGEPGHDSGQSRRRSSDRT